jgi:hypothetical protein
LGRKTKTLRKEKKKKNWRKHLFHIRDERRERKFSGIMRAAALSTRRKKNVKRKGIVINVGGKNLE